MKTTVKKNLIIFHRPSEWAELSERLRVEYGPSVMISFTCKRKLGFTVRHHKGLVPHTTIAWELTKDEGWQHRYHYEDQVHLDFYNEAQQTWFVLKYLNL
jgi:hypothetical protein